MVAVSLYLGLVAIGLAAVYFKFLFRIRRKNEPPIVPGNFIFGSGTEFSKHAVKFLLKTQKQMGNIFTMRLLHQHLTVIMDPHSYEDVVKERNFDFGAIQRQVNHNVFSFNLVDARKMLSEAAKTVKGNYLLEEMARFSRHLNNTLSPTKVATEDRIDMGNGWSSECLRSLTSRTLFAAQFYTIFGTDDGIETVFTPKNVYKQFDVFHQYFNYLWLGLPAKLFPKAIEALGVLLKMPESDVLLKRSNLSNYIRFAINFMKNNGQSECDMKGHNLVYLHVNYNTFRKSFWGLYYLMEHPEALKALREEVEKLVSENINEDGSVNLNMSQLDQLPILDSILKETLRMVTGVFIVRMIEKDTEVTMKDGQTFTVREGDKVAMYPPAIHRDPEIFEDPETFKYDRFVGKKFYKNGKELKNPIFTFGALCPGKKYATIQAKWFLVSFVNNYDFALLDGHKTDLDVRYHGHEILPPLNDVHLTYKPRDCARELVFV